jgi:cytochrome c biogenesis protein CcmG/thiol:disulfide interchange protein DsbE
MTPLNRRLVLLLPLGVAGVAGIGLYSMLDRMRAGKFDPRGVPSALIGKKLPDFSLPGLGAGPGFDGPGFGSGDLTSIGRPVLLNFFASWCVPCIAEADLLMALKQSGQPVFGVAYKDKPEATRAFLQQHGNPYMRVGRDTPGSVAIDFGLYGVPETYLIDTAGIVRWRWAGALTANILRQELAPLLKTLA